ncbi:antibiotic biosynthesis monooxygenase family protein [Enterococcus sp. LJL99]
MSKTVFYCSFKLKKDASIPDFLLAAEKLNNEYISKQEGYISWQQLVDGDTWEYFITFDSMEAGKKFETNSSNAGELAKSFYSFINCNSCKVNYYTVEKNYQ